MATMAVTRANGTDVEDGGVAPPPVGPAARIGLIALRFYKAYLSMLFAGQCRFVPSCSQYSYEAVERFGLARGSENPNSGEFGYKQSCYALADRRRRPPSK